MTFDQFLIDLDTALAHEGIELPDDMLRRIATDLAIRLGMIEVPWKD